MDYAYFHHIVDVLSDRVDDMMNIFPLIFSVLLLLGMIVVAVYGVFKKYKYPDGENDINSESIINPKVDLVIAEVLKSFMIIFGVVILFVLVAQEIVDSHDRRLEIDTTKTWTRVTATILESRTEVKNIDGESDKEHCYHIRVGYDVNQIHYTSEIEFLEQCIPNSLIGVDYSSIAKYYYPLSYTTKVLVDPKNPQHIRDMGYISNSNNHY